MPLFRWFLSWCCLLYQWASLSSFSFALSTLVRFEVITQIFFPSFISVCVCVWQKEIRPACVAMVNISSLKSVSVYIAASYILCFLFAFDYANAYEGVFETVIALSTSTVFRLLAINVVIATHCLLWKLMQGIFFGKLYAAEIVALKSTVPFFLAECAIVCLLGNQFIGPVFCVCLLLTFVDRLLHSLSAERLVTLSTLPAGPERANRVGRLGLFLVVAVSVNYSASVHAWHAVPNATDDAAKSLMYYSCVIFVQLTLSDVRQAFKLLYQQLVEDRTSFFFFVEKFFEICEPLIVILTVLYIWLQSGNLPGMLLHSVSKHAMGLYTNVVALGRYVRLSQRVKSLPCASEQDLARDPACTICYDQMELHQHCRVLPCGHVYHEGCLRHWFESRATCPYCRDNVLERKAAAPAAAAPPPPEAPPPEPEHEIHAGDQGANPVLTENELLSAYGQYLAFLRQQQEAEVPAAAEAPSEGGAAAQAAASGPVPAATARASPPPEARPVGEASSGAPPERDVGGDEGRSAEAAVAAAARASRSVSTSQSGSPKRYLATDRRAARTEVEKAFETFLAEVEEAQNRFLETLETVWERR
ncbi:E3 ubiquitin-protein ligase synoviolin [Strigomonas culicis]|uniref:E3 ubiquitin-protein ligase synoviolin n=1 Tax=Strigomonas culicis TaxID=28005 RepID=S9TYZ5_9TRYP|nr:E3 ubiquitin-protein ligase synoviolin [Strigomonas culicis]|eukprot:EPY23747.1 E3 ubiquitin-protein ligase synoviolin [Strigomonas culicis]